MKFFNAAMFPIIPKYFYGFYVILLGMRIMNISKLIIANISRKYILFKIEQLYSQLLQSQYMKVSLFLLPFQISRYVAQINKMFMVWPLAKLWKFLVTWLVIPVGIWGSNGFSILAPNGTQNSHKVYLESPVGIGVGLEPILNIHQK